MRGARMARARGGVPAPGAAGVSGSAILYDDVSLDAVVDLVKGWSDGTERHKP